MSPTVRIWDLPCALACVGVIGGQALAEPRPYAPAGVRTHLYVEGGSVEALASPGRITDIVLEPGERLTATNPIAAGDTVRWIIGDTASGEAETTRIHVLVKPVEAGLATNLLINTTRRTYRLELRSVGRGADIAVGWRYPPPRSLPSPSLPSLGAQVAAASSQPAASLAPDVAPAQPTAFFFGYRLSGARVPWRPTRVYDDGRRTIVEFTPQAARRTLPPLFAVGPDGKSAELLNYRVEGHRLIVESLIDQAELRLGQGRSARRVRISREAAR